MSTQPRTRSGLPQSNSSKIPYLPAPTHTGGYGVFTRAPPTPDDDSDSFTKSYEFFPPNPSNVAPRRGAVCACDQMANRQNPYMPRRNLRPAARSAGRFLTDRP